MRVRNLKFLVVLRGGEEMTNEKIETIKLTEKLALTIEEAAEFSSIGINKIRELLRDPECPFALHIGRRTLVKRRRFEEYIETQYSI